MQQLVAVTSLTVVLAAAGAAVGQVATQQPQAAPDPMSSVWNPQMMIERSVKQATQRYHLTPAQEQVARKMTTDGVNAFLDKHEQDLRDLLRQAIQARLSGQTPTPDQAKAWAEKARPLFEEAKKAIVDGNRQFRDSLTDEQKKTFDADQKDMEQQLNFNAGTLDRWSRGEFDAGRDWNNGRDSQAPTSQPRPELDRFERYARRFIENYKLDAGQIAQVMGIVAQNRKRAEEYWYSHKTDMQVVRSRVQEFSRDPNDRQRYLEATRQLAELNKPVNDVYNEMRERLDLIPTESQRKVFDETSEARRQAWRDQMRRGSETTVSSTSQTAASQSTASSQQILADEGAAVTTRSATSRPTATRPLATRPAAGLPWRSSSAATQPVRR